MPLDFQRARPLLQSGNLTKLFVEELGWEPSRQKLTLRAGEADYAFAAVAEKRGFTAWLCASADGKLPDHRTRLKLDRALTQTSFEHLIVFAAKDYAQQSWMWVRREPGKPLSARTHEFNRAQPGDSLLQKLQILYVSLEEEEAGLSVTEIASRARAAFDIEHVTKAFYRDFDNGKDIQIPDKAFERVFDYFDQYQWHLDERPLRADNEINPDLLGYIFEKYINQKQMGAYYTKEDITEYIAKNTVLPFVFDAARARCKVAFENPNGPTVWDLLRENPDRYIYPAVRHGMDKKLPPEIAAGLDITRPNLIERRKAWNKPAPGDCALPTEIWREVVARPSCDEGHGPSGKTVRRCWKVSMALF